MHLHENRFVASYDALAAYYQNSMGFNPENLNAKEIERNAHALNLYRFAKVLGSAHLGLERELSHHADA